MTVDVDGTLVADVPGGYADAARSRPWEPDTIVHDPAAMDRSSAGYKTMTGPLANAAAANTPAWRQAETGAANGHGNARSVARIGSVISRGGTVDGVRLLSPETIGQVFRGQTRGTDLFLGIPIRFGVGYGLSDPRAIPFVAAGKACFWGGWGGSVIIMDTGRRLTVSHMMNQMHSGLVGSENAAAYRTTICKLPG